MQQNQKCEKGAEEIKLLNLFVLKGSWSQCLELHCSPSAVLGSGGHWAVGVTAHWSLWLLWVHEQILPWCSRCCHSWVSWVGGDKGNGCVLYLLLIIVTLGLIWFSHLVESHPWNRDFPWFSSSWSPAVCGRAVGHIFSLCLVLLAVVGTRAAELHWGVCFHGKATSLLVWISVGFL